MPKLSPDQINQLGIKLSSKFEKYANDRKALEQQWMKNLRQYRGKYDPEVEARIPADRSKVYPRDTRVRVNGFVAKMMEMMFPVSDVNFEITPTTQPSIPKNALDQIILGLEQANFAKMAETQQVSRVTSEQIESAVIEYADRQARKMEKECRDQLDDIDYPELCKKVLRSGAVYSCGILKGPMVKYQTERYWEPSGGTYKAVEKRRPRPTFGQRKIWDIFPDLGARSWWQQDGLFERLPLTHNELKTLSDRKEFYGGTIKRYLADHASGNYTQRDFEADLHELNHTSNIDTTETTKYEVIIYYGFITSHDLTSMGVVIPEAEMSESYLVEVWTLGDRVIKYDDKPFGVAPHSKYHVFIYGEDEDSALTGVGLPEDMRDSQMSICSATRMLMDNAASSAGPIFEVNKDLLARGHDIGSIHSFKTIYREGIGAEASAQAVRSIQVDSHINELTKVIELFRQNLDFESATPAWTLGQPQQLGEAFRTSNNMSMMSGGANLITKDVTRSFDRFTSSVINSLVQWNMEFGDDDIKGDFQVMAKGSRSLVAKEVRGQAVEQFIATLDEDEKALFKKVPLLIERMKARDIPFDKILVTEEQAREILDKRAQSSAEAQQVAMQGEQAKAAKVSADAQKSTAQAQEIMASLRPKLEKILAETGAITAGQQQDIMELIMEQME